MAGLKVEAAHRTMRSISRRSLFVPTVGTLVVFAWAALFAWERSPYARYIQHGELGHLHVEHGFEALLGQAALYVVGWLLMIVAMMLPTTLPLIEIFRRLVRERIDRGVLTALLILGYLVAWLAFGVAAHAADWWLHRWFGHSTWLQQNAWVFGAGPLIAAGLFQFSRLKSRCLDECRSPLSFVSVHWGSGERPRQRAFRTGLDHGVFCVGCCWALMLLMFAVGTGSVGWMLLLGALMAIEKNVAWGRHISTPLGVALIAWGVLIAVDHTFSWQ